MSRWLRRKQSPSDADLQWSNEIVPRIETGKEDRLRKLVGQEDRVTQLERLLFEHDPIGINFEDNTDEYRPEAETITLRLPEATSEMDVLRIVYEEFLRWFGDSTAGPESRYQPIASEVWGMLQETREA